jgi:antirestriction protein ArdC
VSNEKAKELTAGIKSAAEQLAAEIAEGKSDRLEAYLRFASRFHTYSFGNQLLIHIQRSTATHVAGYRTWERKGYHVAKGEKGIAILAPRPYTRENDDGEPETKVYFKVVYVFDASQLNPEELAAKPLPSFYMDLGSDEQTEELCQRAVECMTASGIRVVEESMSGTQQGYSAGGYVATRKGLASRNRIRTLVHEWAHELLHQADTDEAKADRARGKQVVECHAEATSFVVLAHYGIRNELSSDYLQHWGNTPETLMAELTKIQKAATVIIGALEAKAGDQETEAEEEVA